jgi:uncharacterized protein
VETGYIVNAPVAWEAAN